MRWVLEDEGRPVSWGRKRRSVDPVLRRLIEDRDRACRVPWCTQTRWLETHHLLHVEDGGETMPENLVGLCPRDHDLHHRGLLGIRGDPTRPDGLVFTDRHGRVITAAPQPVAPGRPPAEAAHDLGIDTGTWEPPTGERFDPHWFEWR